MNQVKITIQCLLPVLAIAMLTACDLSFGSPLPSPPQTSYIAKEPVSDIFFADALHGWISRGLETNALLRTDDGGASWRVINRTIGLSQMFFLDSKVGWGFHGVPLEGGDIKTELVSTRDGGYSWKPLATIATVPGLVITKTFFLDERHGWFVGTQDRGRSLVFATSDGGNSVRKIAGLSDREDATTSIFGDRNSGKVWIVGKETIAYSGDRGTTWQTQFARGSLPSRFAELDLYSGQMFPDGHGWAVGNRTRGIILSTADYGVNWRVSLQNVEGDFKSVSFWDEDHGCVGGAYGIILCTFDGGMNWMPRTVLPRSSGERLNVNDVGDITGLVTPGPTKWWAIGNVGFLFQSNDGGATWVLAHLPQ